MKRLSKLKPLNINVNKSETYQPLFNKDTILNEINAKIGTNKGPSIEYLYVVPHVQFSLSLLMRGMYSSSNPYGHAAIRYTLNDGSDYVMNIVGKPGKKMVNIMPTYDYIFGDPNIILNNGSEQGGIYQRTIIGFRLENYPLNLIQNMHNYFIELQKLEKDGQIGFNLASLNFYIPFISKYIERGNCALWTSKGLVKCGIFRGSTIFPKYIFVKLYVKCLNSWGWLGICHKTDNIQCSIVNYNRVLTKYEQDIFKQNNNNKYKEPFGWVSPFLFSKSNRKFRNLQKFANVDVTLHSVNVNGNDMYKADITSNEPWMPKWIGSVFNF